MDLPDSLDSYHLRYDIDYLEDQAGDIPTRILPGTMDAYYTEYFVFTRIEGFFSQFSLVMIADLQYRRVTTLLNFFGNKVFYEGETGELPAGIYAPDRLRTRKTGKSTVIGGLESEEILVTTDRDTFRIYATDQFSVRRPNISTPYHSVHDPLTEFEIQLSVLKMHLRCKQAETRQIESSMFRVPEGYKEVNRESMEEIINSLFTKD